MYLFGLGIFGIDGSRKEFRHFQLKSLTAFFPLFVVQKYYSGESDWNNVYMSLATCMISLIFLSCSVGHYMWMRTHADQEQDKDDLESLLDGGDNSGQVVGGQSGVELVEPLL